MIGTVGKTLVCWPRPVDACRGAFARARLARRTWPGLRAALAGALLALLASVVPLGSAQADCGAESTSYVGTSGDCKGLLVVTQSEFDAVGSYKIGGNYSFSITKDGTTYEPEQWYTGNITDMGGFFWDYELFVDKPFPNVEEWDTSQVEDMSYLFASVENFNQDIGDWDVSSVTNMNGMFSGADAFNRDIGDWNVGKVTTMSYMFQNAVAFNKDISGWDVSRVRYMDHMFRDADVFNKDIGGWDVSRVIAMRSMFESANHFNQDLSPWDVEYFDDEPPDFNTGARQVWVDTPEYQPQWGAPVVASFSPDQDASDVALDTDLVLTFSTDVEEGSGFINLYTQADSSEVEQINISSAQVTFADSAVTIDLSSDLAGETTYYVTVDDGAIISAENSVTYIGFDDGSTWSFTTGYDPNLRVALSTEAQAPVSGEFEVEVAFSREVTDFVQADIDHENGTISNFSGSGQNYTFDVRPEATGDVVIKVPAGVATDADGVENSYAELVVEAEVMEVTLSTQELQPVSGEFEVEVVFSRAVTDFVQADIDYENATIRNFSGSGQNYTFDVTPVASGDVTLSVPENVATDGDGVVNSAAELVVVADLGADDPGGCEINEDTPNSFVGTVAPCKDFLVVSQEDFDAVGSTESGGDGSFSLTKNGKTYGVDQWYTRNITDMSEYFQNADDDLDGPLPSIEGWDTSQVTSMQSIFEKFDDFNQDIGAWDVGSVTKMYAMFYMATNFDQPIGGWDVSKVRDMAHMFDDATDFNQSLQDWDTSEVTRMSSMFSGAKNFEGDIGDWDVSNVTRLSGMFLYAEKFNADIGGWDVRNVESMDHMFEDAVSFDRDLSDWDVSKVTDMDNMFRNASSFNQDLSGWDVSYFEEEPSHFNSGANSTWVANDAWQPQWGKHPPPQISDYSPEQNASDVTLDAALTLTFNKTVQAGSGTIKIYDLNDSSSPFAELDVTQSGVTFLDVTVTIDPANNFSAGETYAVTIDQGAIVDSEQEAFVGISDTAQWQFTTTGTGVSASESSVTANASAVGLDDFAVITVTVKDASGAAVTGVADQILGSVDLDGASFFGPFTEDEQTAGLYTAGLESTAAGAATVRIEVAGTQLDDTATVTFVAAPAAPTDLSVTPADGSLALTWVAPDDGGSAITHYEYKLTQGEAAGSYVSTNSTSPSASIAIQNGLAYSVLVRAVNAYGNGVDSQTVTLPSVTLGTDLADADVVAEPFTVTAVFSESVTGFEQEDISVTKGSLSAFAGSGGDYSFTVTPTEDGDVTVRVPASVATSGSGQLNTASVALVQAADVTGATLTLSSEAENPVTETFTVLASFSEAVTSFDPEHISLDKATLGEVTEVSSTVYSFQVTPVEDGTVTVSVAAGAAEDALGNPSTQDSLERTADVSRPVPSLKTSAPAYVNGPFSVTVEFSEAVTDFTEADLEVSNALIDEFTGAEETYNFNVTPQEDGPVTVDVPAGVAQDLAGNSNTAATPLQVSADLTGPTVGLTSDADPVGGVFTVTVEFSEAVTGFALGHIAVGNGVASNLTGSEADYSFEVTPSSNGTVTVDVAADVVMDSVGNGNRAATRLEVTADLQAPTVSLFTEAGDFVAGAFTVTATFSEAVTGFALNDDVVVTNASVDGFTGSGAEYSFEVTPLSDGLVTVDIGAGAAQDGVGNPTAAAAQLSRTADLIAPTVTLKTSALEPINGTFAVTAEFSEEVSNFTLEDLTLGNASADTLTGAGKVYDFNVTPTGTGTMTIAVVEDGAQDRAGNGNEASNELSLTADLERPTLELETQATSPVGAKFAVTATFTEAVTNFDSSDVQVTNGSVDNFQGSGQAYSFDITPAGNGDVRVDVAADAAQDAAGNGNEAAQTLSMVADLEGSTLGLNTEAGSPLGGLFLVTATFSEDVTGFELGDIQVDNGTADKFSGSGASYSFEVSPLSDGTVTVRVAENVAVDGANNGNAAAQLEREADLTDPTVDLSTLAAGPFAGVFSVTVEFSEDVTDFGLDDVVVSNATLGNLLGSGAVYTFNVTPLATGLVTVDVPADAAFDAAGNPNEAAAQLEREADLTAPTVSLETLAGDVVSDVFAVTATFSENVTGFEAEDVTVVNGEVSAFVATSAQAYSFDVTPLEEGPVTVDVLKDVAHDGAGNGNTAATQLEVTASLSAASVELATEAVSPVTGAFSVTATFTKAVTGFAVDDVTVGNGGASNFSGSGSDYRFDVTPAGDGVVSVDVAAGVATDGVGNGNTAAQTLSVTADVTAPLLSLSTEATGTVIAPFMVEAGFSEDVNGFVEGDVAVTNGTVGDFTSVSASAYTFEVTPASSGDVVVTVASGAASDDAGHSNAAASLEVTADVDAPTVSLSTTAAQPVASTFSLTATFSDAVTGFSNAGIHVINGDLEAETLVSTDDQTYQFDVTPSGGGDVRVQIVAGAAQDDAGNASTASNELSLATDEDVSGLEFVVSQSSLDLSEGSSETLTLALGLRPSGQVSLGLASSNTGVVNVSAAALIFDPDDWNVAQTVTVTAQEISGNADASASLILVATGAEFDGVSHTLAVAIDNSDGLDEDTGALAASIATSEVMGSQLGDLISDAAVGGLSRGPTLREGDLVENGLPGGNIIQFAQQPQDPNYRRLHILSARDGGQGFSLVDWFSVGLSSASVDAELQGDGSFAYAVIGSEMTKTANAVGGLLYGFEASSWDYEAETDVDRAGISVGYYGARRDRGLVYTGSTTLTLSQNDFVTASGATGTAGSYRLILKAGISGDRTIGEGGGRLTPFVDLMYASEQLEAFVFSDGSTSSQSTADLGRLGVGLEYATAPSATGNQVMVRGELSQVFGASDLTLSDGETYSPNEAPVGSVTFGWISKPGADSIARIELTFGELGNDEAEEVRLDGTVDRNF